MRETGRLRVMGAAGSPEEAGEYRPLEGLSRASRASAVLLEGLCLFATLRKLLQYL